MLVKDSLDEVKKRENSLRIIKSIIKTKGRNHLYDLTGLSGGFLATQKDLDLLETYIGPAIFEEELQKLGQSHLGGEKIFAVNRTSSGILATILAIVKKDSYVFHFLPEFPAHPSIPRSCNIVGAKYLEFDDIDEFKSNFNDYQDEIALIIITGSTMDHKVIDEDIFKEVIEKGKSKDIPVLVDDASGARLRTAIFNQKRAIDLGADLVVTSTDKLMQGPRGGLMAGSEKLINEIIAKSTQFGLEAQPPSILAMVKGLENYDEEKLRVAVNKKEELMNILSKNFSIFEKTPTGVMVSELSLKKEVDKKLKIFDNSDDNGNINNNNNNNNNNNISGNLSNKDLCFLWSMILLKEENIVTIPAVSMPGASPTIRFDLSSNDANNLSINDIYNKIKNSFESFLGVLKMNNNEEIAKDILFKTS